LPRLKHPPISEFNEFSIISQVSSKQAAMPTMSRYKGTLSWDLRWFAQSIAVRASRMNGGSGRRDLVLRAWWSALIAISAFCLCMTFYSDELAASWGAGERFIRWLWVRKFELGRENSFGSWWSGTLLLIACLHSLDGFVAGRADARGAWLCLALVLALLSLDEVGSLHERAAVYVPPYGAKVNLLLGSLLAGVVAAAAAVLARDRSSRTTVWLIAIAFTFLAGAALQDLAPARMGSWTSDESTRRTLQAGCGIAGMLLLILATSRNSAGVFDRSRRDSEPVFTVLDRHAASLVVAGLLITTPVSIATVMLLSDNYQGLPANWLGASVFLAAGLLALRPVLRFGWTGSYLWRNSGIATICFVMSALTVFRPFLQRPGRKSELLLFACAAIALLWLLRRARPTARLWVTAILVIIPPATAQLWPSVLNAMLAYGFAGWLVLWGNRELVRDR
jgi:hypothetical protein